MSETTPHSPQTFWQRPIVQQLVPWGTSLLFHLAVIGLGLLVYKTAEVILRSVRQEQIVIPDTNLVEQADAGGVPNPGINADPTRAAAQGADEIVKDSNDWAKRKSDTLVANLTQGSADQKADVTPIGVAAKTSGSVTGLTDRGNGGGTLAPFGPAGAGGGQGKGLFGLPGGNVRRVAYVCDASGSMIGTLQTLLNNELHHAIEGLRLSQSFNVIFFQNDEPAVVQKGSLLIATPKNKQAAYDFLARYEVKGSTNPIPALAEAFAMKPELVFVLTDGAFDEPEKVVASLAKLNAEKKVHVNTILFVSTDDTTNDAIKDAERTMTQIATDNGGTYKLVRASDLQR